VLYKPPVKIEPDFSRLLKVLRREGVPDRVPFFELLADPPVISAILGESLPDIRSKDHEIVRQAIDKDLKFWLNLGYDYYGVRMELGFKRQRHEAPDTASLSRGTRQWVDGTIAQIKTRKDMEDFPWPRVESLDFWNLDYARKVIPDGMKLIPRVSGILENTMWLMGYEGLAFALIDDPEFAGMVFDRVGSHIASVCEAMSQPEEVGAIVAGDDFGFKTQTMISPDDLRKYVLKWHKRIARIARNRGIPYILHSCGNLQEVMQDLIDDVGIDAKHSFEDVILPVTEAKRLYGDRIAILGGVDVGFLTRASEAEVRARTREILSICALDGGYALGTGNSVANYIKVENFLAMIDEGYRFSLEGR